jgi:hypothetical protein
MAFGWIGADDFGCIPNFQAVKRGNRRVRGCHRHEISVSGRIVYDRASRAAVYAFVLSKM